MSTEKHVTVSVTPLWFLFLLFLGLKLADVIQWSWWWVFAPLWLPFATLSVIAILAVLFIALFGKG